MENNFNQILWRQTGATINMLENAIIACPEDLWNTHDRFWYISYHTIFWLDLYSDKDPMTFAPPAPFTLSEMDPADVMPDRHYTKDELLHYLKYAGQKSKKRITNLNIESDEDRFINNRKNYPALEIMLYNLRHMQHHIGQLNMLLRQNNIAPPDWISQAE